MIFSTAARLPVIYCYIGLLFFTCASAGARPPVITEDTGTPGEKKWEINTARRYTRGSGATDSTLPFVDVNYGIGARGQFKYEIGGLEHRAPDESTQRAISDSLVGLKWRLREGEDYSISIFPQVQFQTPGSSARVKGLEDNGVATSVPMQVSTSIAGTALDLEAGPVFHSGDDSRWCYGFAVSRAFSERLELAIELRGEALSGLNRNALSVNVGAHLKVVQNGGLLLLLGRDLVHSKAGGATFTTYVGWQLLR